MLAKINPLKFKSLMTDFNNYNDFFIKLATISDESIRFVKNNLSNNFIIIL